MESKNLNDIVIEDADNNKRAQLKNILTLLALLFIILVISIVITKLILGSDTDDNTTSLSSDTASQTQDNGDAESDNSSNTVAAVATGAAATTAVTAIANSVSNNGETKKDTEKTSSSSSSTLPDRNSSSKKKLPLRDHKPKREVTRTVKKESTKKVVHRNEYRPVVKRKVTKYRPPVKKSSTSTAPVRGYYIKVGTFKDTSNAIKKVKANHLKYKTVKMESGGATRVLVGPYYSHKAAEKDIAKVKADIAKDAYIMKMP